MKSKIEKLFNESAQHYDERYERLAPLQSALHLCMRGILAKLPADARILCVGAGTGQELIFLAKHFPTWHFTVVEPSAAMLDICKQKAKKEDIASRCSFHEGYLDTLPKEELFHGATAILVSQFILETNERCAFFREIASRLVVDGLFINADLSANMDSDEFIDLLTVWANMQSMDSRSVSHIQEQWKKHVAVISQKAIEAMIESSGFAQPILFYQATFIHAWFAQKKR